MIKIFNSFINKKSYYKILLFFIMMFISYPVYASEKVYIKSATCENMNNGQIVENYNTVIKGLNINADDARFTSKNDYLKCTIEIKNDSNDSIYLNSNSITNKSNDNISYEMSSEGKGIININESKTYYLNITYQNEYSDENTIANNINLIFEDKNINNPITGNSLLTIVTILVILSVIGIVLLVKSKNKKVLYIILVACSINMFWYVNALTEYKVVFNNQIIIEVPSYSLKIDPNNGTYDGSTGIKEYNVKKNNNKEINTPTRTGYTFTGWTLTGEGSSIDNNIFKMGNEDATLTANWTINQYTLIIDANGGTYEGNTIVPLNYLATTTISEPQREGYTFVGWTVEGGTLSDNVFTLSDDSNAKLTANWVVNSYAYLVTHSQMNVDGNGYTLIEVDSESGERDYGTVITPSVKTYDGFTSPSLKSLTIQVDTNPPTKNILNYNYSRNKYNITINNGSNTTTLNAYYQSRVLIETPSKDYYNFDGWTMNGGTIEDSYLIVPSKDVQLTARFTPIEYNITYNLAGGDLDNLVETYNVESNNIVVGTPNRLGYKFLGWTGSNGDTPETSLTIPKGTHGNLEYTANWEKIGNIVYDCDNNAHITTIPDDLDGLAKIMAKEAYLDSGKSEYVSSCSGINFKNTSSTTNGKGIYEIDSTKNDDCPIYYYRGNITNNNVKFGNYCWKIVRTTDTCGVKLLYNGLVTDGKCNGASSTIIDNTTYKFNNSDNSVAYIGYMYGTKDHTSATTPYTYSKKTVTTSTTVLGSMDITKTHYFATTYDWNTTNTNKYTIGSDAALASTYSDDYSQLVGMYTFSGVNSNQAKSATGTYSSIRYIVGYKDSKLYYVTLSGGNNQNAYNKTYYFYNDKSLNGEVSITTFNWLDNYTTITNGMYACNNTQNCSSPLVIGSTSETGYAILNSDGNLFGNSVSYSDGTYTLVDTIQMNNTNYTPGTNFNNNHYTCFNNTGSCQAVYYVFYVSGSNYYYISINGINPGTNELIEVIKEDMFSNDVNSNAKTIVDSWYSANMSAYTSALEDTVYCNDRSVTTNNGWNPDGGPMDTYISFSSNSRVFSTYKPTLACPKVKDRFTVSSSIGNGKLTYPVGLLTIDEAAYAGGIGGMNVVSTTYIKNGKNLYVMTPHYYYSEYAGMFGITTDGSLSSGILYRSNLAGGLRPVISLSKNSSIPSSGDGTPENPYVINVE